MDYPHPLEELKADGTIDLSKAYATHIGDWDKVTINYGYREFPKSTADAAPLPQTRVVSRLRPEAVQQTLFALVAPYAVISTVL